MGGMISRSSMAAGLAAAMLWVGPVQAQTTPQAADPADGPPADIVVTAQKRAESIQEVPFSISAFSQADLAKRGVESLYDVSRIAPSLAVLSSGPGENNLIIRGISSIAGSAATVGYYLDDTPIAASSNAALLSTRGVIDPSLLDIARIEVLRGPQGTLYGSSSMGGTVRFISNQPDAERVEGRVHTELSGTHHGGFNYDFDGVLNVPIVSDRVALRVAGYYKFEDGYIDRYAIDPANYLGIDPASRRQQGVNTYRTYGTRASLLVKVTDRLTITPSILYQYTRLGSPFTFDAVPGSLSNPIQNRDVAEPNVQKSVIGNIVVREDTGPVELLSSTSYYDRDVRITEDASKVISFFFGTPAVTPVGITGDYRNHELTEEVRATTKLSGPFQAIIGGFYHDVRAPLASAIPFPANFPYLAAQPFASFNSIYRGTRRATLKEYAGFGELSYRIIPRVTVRGGVRVFQVNQTFDQTGDGVFNGGFSEVYGTSRDHGVTPKGSIEWQVTPDKLLYATASRGYRPGGPNNPAPASLCGAELAGLGLAQSQLTRYGADSLWNYEVGAKTSWLGRRLTVNGSAFYIDWSRVQQQIVLQCGFNLTANFGGATSRGGELEVNFQPTRKLTFGAGAGYTDAYLRNAVPGTPAQRGDPLQGVPRWTVSGSGEYRDRLTDALKGFGRVDLSYVGPATFLYDRTSPFARRAGFTIVNARLGLEPDRMPWEASLFVKNVFDVRGETDLPVAIAADLPTTRREGLNEPRTIGISAGYRF